MSYVYKMQDGKLTKKNVVRKSFNPRSYAMAKEEAYMQASAMYAPGCWYRKGKYAESNGKYFNSNIRNRYEYELVAA